MNYKLKLHKKAKKFLLSREFKDREKIIKKLEQLQQEPIYNEKLDIAKLKGYDSRYRLRVNNYRIIYEIYNSLITIYILNIGNRGDIYK
jgi:mRNA interferase RelE/StbE